MTGLSDEAVAAFRATLTEYGNTPGGRSRALAAAYSVIRGDVLTEAAAALRQESKRVRFVAAWRSAADFLDKIRTT